MEIQSIGDQRGRGEWKGDELCGSGWKPRVGGEHPVMWTEVEMQCHGRET